MATGGGRRRAGGRRWRPVSGWFPFSLKCGRRAHRLEALTLLGEILQACDSGSTAWGGGGNRPLFCSGSGVASDRLPNGRRPAGSLVPARCERSAVCPPGWKGCARASLHPLGNPGSYPAVGTEVKNKTGNVTGGGPRRGRSDVAWTRFPYLPLRLSPFLLSEMRTSSFPAVAAAGAPHGPTPLGGKAESL